VHYVTSIILPESDNSRIGGGWVESPPNKYISGQDHEGGDLKKSEEVFELTLIVGDDTAVVLKPCEKALHLPPVRVTASTRPP